MGKPRRLGERRSRHRVCRLSRKLPRAQCQPAIGRAGGDDRRAQSGVRAQRSQRCRSRRTARGNFLKTISGRCASPSLATPTAFSPDITSRSSRVRAFPPASSRRRFFAGRPISLSPASANSATRFQARASRSAGASAAASSCLTMTAPPIEDGALDGWHLEICWLRSDIDVLFAQIQGSARIRLEDGTILRVNYDSHNGWPYTPSAASSSSARSSPRTKCRCNAFASGWPPIRTRPRTSDGKTSLMCSSALPVWRPQDEAVGGEGVPLVPGRSIAVDRSLHAYGTPFFITADLPIANEKSGTKFRRLMFAQDTGSAIVGPARADIYFGAGAEAAQHCRPHQESRPVRDAAAARTRSGRGGAHVPLAAGAAAALLRAIGRRQHDRSDGGRGAAAANPSHRAAAPSRSRRGRKPKVKDLAHAMSRRRSAERGRTRAVERLCTIDQAAGSGAAPAETPTRRRRSSPNRSAAVDDKPARRSAVAPASGRKSCRAKKAPPLAPLGRRLKQRVARGREPIDARLDLHGFTQTRGACGIAALSAARASRRRQDCAGRHRQRNRQSDPMPHERGVLKRQVPLWLSLPRVPFAGRRIRGCAYRSRRRRRALYPRCGARDE